MLGGHRSNCRASEVGRTTASDASIGQPTAINTYLTYQCFHSSQWHPPCTVGVPPLHPRPLTQWSLRKGKKDTHTHTHTHQTQGPASQPKLGFPGSRNRHRSVGFHRLLLGRRDPPFQQATYPKASCMALFFVASHTDFTPNYLRKGRGRRKIIMLVCDKAHN